MHNTNSSESNVPSLKQDASKSYFSDENFRRFFRFAAIDNSGLIISLLLGFSIDSFIARRIGVHGYGPIIGACFGNVLSDGVAAVPEGKSASIGALAGGMVPAIPLIASLVLRKQLTTRVKQTITACSLVLLLPCLFVEHFSEEEQKDNSKVKPIAPSPKQE